MKRITLLCALPALAVTALIAGLAFSQDKEAATGAMHEPSPEQMQAMMKEYMKTIEPGEGHKRLEYFIGTWDTVTLMWMGGPGSEPTESKGRSVMKWILGGRYVLHDHQGQMLVPDATGTMTMMPYNGMGLTGYDNVRNLYVSSWVNNMSTQMLTMKGACDPAGKVFTYYGEMDEPGMKVFGRVVKYVCRIIDKDKYVFEIIDLHAGDDYKVIEITYSRTK